MALELTLVRTANPLLFERLCISWFLINIPQRSLYNSKPFPLCTIVSLGWRPLIIYLHSCLIFTYNFVYSCYESKE